jgi:DNA-binding NtrC family response regulator
MSVHTEANDRSGGRAPEAGPGPRAAPRARILVVDDEPLVGLVIQRAFEDEHEVVLAGSARAALDLLDAGERFDVLCSDLMMPDMDGAALHAEVAGRDPALARCTVFLTGGAYTQEAFASLEAAHAEVLEKPFELSALRDLVDRLLSSRRAG